jgi:hypothetical protein
LITVVSAVLSPALRNSHTAFTFADLRGGGAVVSKSLDDEHQRMFITPVGLNPTNSAIA